MGERAALSQGGGPKRQAAAADDETWTKATAAALGLESALRERGRPREVTAAGEDGEEE